MKAHYLESVFKKVTLKRIVEGRGHDGGGLIADICFNGKVVGSFHDDGWGGEPTVTINTSADKKKIIDFFKSENVEELLIGDLKRTHPTLELDFDDVYKQLESVVYCYSDYISEQKIVSRNKNKSLIYKDSVKALNINKLRWGKPIVTLATLVTVKGGLDILQSTVNRLKAEGKIIMNPTEQLEELGVKM